MNQTFSKIWILIILAVFVAGGILTWQYLGTLKQKEVIKEEITNWKTYKNEGYKFEVKYPGGWNYGPNILRTGPDLVFCPPEFSDPDPELKCKWESKDGHMPGSLAPIGLFVWKAENFPGETDKKGVWKDPNGRYVYELNLFNNSFQDTYDQMLSTFKFLE